MKVKVKVPGSCGEFVQGFFCGEPILITCPIEMYSTVTISDEFVGIEGLGEKSLMVLDKTLKLFDVSNFNFGIKLVSELPHGKGMASSSADMAAVVVAVAIFFGKEPPYFLLPEIEPTDGIFYNGIVAMNPLTGKFIKNIFVPNKYQIAIFDYGGEVDTLKFNRRSDFQIDALEDTLNFELVEESARTNQTILYKRGLEEIIAFAKNIGAVTVNVAHSGTVVGVFFYSDDGDIDKKISEIDRRFDFIKFMTKTRLTDGGYHAKISTRRNDLQC